MIGRCKNCKWRDPNGHCQNDERLHENDYEHRGDTSDHLVYSYSESGWFWVGPEFGCVHFEEAQ